MVVTLTYIALALLAVFLLFLAAGTVKDNIEREKERRENIASQFSGRKKLLRKSAQRLFLL